MHYTWNALTYFINQCFIIQHILLAIPFVTFILAVNLVKLVMMSASQLISVSALPLSPFLPPPFLTPNRFHFCMLSHGQIRARHCGVMWRKHEFASGVVRETQMMSSLGVFGGSPCSTWQSSFWGERDGVGCELRWRMIQKTFVNYSLCVFMVCRSHSSR